MIDLPKARMAEDTAQCAARSATVVRSGSARTLVGLSLVRTAACLCVAPFLLSCAAQTSLAPSAAVKSSFTEPFPPPVVTGREADLPIKMEQFLIVEATLNDQGPFRFIVDTGAAGHTLRILPHIVERLGLKQVGTTKIGDGSGPDNLEVPTYDLGTVKLGGLTYKNVGAFARTLPKRFNVDGILPFGFFRNMLLAFDYGKARMRVSRGSLPKPNGANILSYDPRDEQIYTEISVGDKKFPVFIDTGAVGAPLIVPTAMAESMPTKGEPRPAGTVTTTSNKLEVKIADLAAPVKLGSVMLPVTSVKYPAPWPEGNLGARAFDGMVLTIDSRNHRLKVAPSR